MRLVDLSFESNFAKERVENGLADDGRYLQLNKFVKNKNDKYYGKRTSSSDNCGARRTGC